MSASFPSIITEAKAALSAQVQRLTVWARRSGEKDKRLIQARAKELSAIDDLIGHIEDTMSSIGHEAYEEGFRKGFALAKKIYDVDNVTPALQAAVRQLSKKS